MSTVVSVVPVPWIAALAWNHVSKYGVSVLAAEINKNWNVNEVKTDKNRYHHWIRHSRLS